VKRALGVALGAAFALSACHGAPRGGGECAAFGVFTHESYARADGAVPEAERNLARSALDISAWQKNLAKAFDVEAAAPAHFESAKVKDWEAHYKRTYGLTASSLRKMSSSLERGDRSAYAAAVEEQTAAARERQRIVDDWKRHCTE
jgi:hypothetical protein